MVRFPRIHKLSYWKLHFGTDILVSSWCLIISTFFFLLIPISYFSGQKQSSGINNLYYGTLLISGTCYFFGNFYFLSISYPSAMDDLMASAMTTDISNLSFADRYFFGNNLLIMTWSFTLALLPFAIYFCVASIFGYVSLLFGLLVLVGFIISSLSSFFWILSCLPESIVKNEGKGSSYFIEFLECNNLFCGIETHWRTNFSSDFLVGSWLFFFTSVFSFVSASVNMILYYINFEIVSYLISSCFLVIGSGLLVHASYPGNFTSDLTWRLITCGHQGESLFLSKEGNENRIDESTPLTNGQPMISDSSTFSDLEANCTAPHSSDGMCESDSP